MGVDMAVYLLAVMQLLGTSIAWGGTLTSCAISKIDMVSISQEERGDG